MIPGDGIGKLVLPAAQRILLALPRSLLPPLNFIPLLAGYHNFVSTGHALPEETLRTMKSGECNAAMFGAVSSPSDRVEGYSSPIVRLRKELDLYANVRPVSGGERRVDMTIVRENTECLYIKQERLEINEKGEKVAFATRRISERASRRIGQMGFEISLMNAELKSLAVPQKVTIVHKSNVLSVTDGLFRETIRSLHSSTERYQKIPLDEQIVDSLVYKLFREPQNLQILVCPNLYGDIVSDGAAALVGSLGLVPSVNVGDTFIMGEPVHGSAPDIADLKPAIANPIASVRSAALMLQYLGYTGAAAKIYSAVDEVLEKGGREGWLTPDLGGRGTTDGVTDEIGNRL